MNTPNVAPRIHTLFGTCTMDGKLHWNLDRTLAWPDEEEALFLRMNLSRESDEEREHREQQKRFQHNRVTWIARNEKRWFLDLDKLRQFAPNLTDFPWARGIVEVMPKITGSARSPDNKYFTFKITEEYMNEVAPQRIFLSHKGADKPTVRKYARMLTELGFQPWLDEEAMAAGANLERALLQGMKDSCAVVFFVTENYRDENYLATEIEYSVFEKRLKRERFAIITLVMGDGHREVPGLLTPYVWKRPQSEFEALEEIIRALPIKLPRPIWK